MYCSPSSTSTPSPHLKPLFTETHQPHPLLKLMSLSATLPSISSYETMLLKSGQLPGGSPVPIPSPSGSGGHPESPKSSATPTTLVIPEGEGEERKSETNNNNNHHHQPHPPDDDDKDEEVLSIGGHDLETKGEEEEEDIEIMDVGEGDKGETEGEEEDDKLSLKSHVSHQSTSSPTLLQNQSHHPHHDRGRERKYSSEDSFSIRSLCSPSTTSSTTSTNSSSVANNNMNIINMNNQNNNGDMRNAANRSLLFSIANILRPDFGTSPSPFVPQKRSIKSPPDFGELYKPYTNFLMGGGTPANPIDLSRHHNNSNTTTNNNKISSSSSERNHHHQLLHKTQKPTKIRPVPPSSSSSSRGRDKDNSKEHSNDNNNKNRGDTPLPPLPQGNGNKSKSSSSSSGGDGQNLWPAWVYCTRYSDRPSSGPRARRERKNKVKESDEKRPRTAFTAEQLSRLKKEFEENRYLTEKRRQDLARELRLHENQIKIWFQNKRAKLKKASGQRGGLALQLMAQGLYNHSTIPKSGPEDEDSD